MKRFNFLIRCISLIFISYLFAVNSCFASTEPTLKLETRTTFKLGSLFKNHMVLQRDQSIPVWGKAEVGATITVTFANSEKSTVTDSNGDWSIELNPLKASFEPKIMMISSSLNKEDLKISDIVVGDVWICSGQSNMEWPLDGISEIKVLIPNSSNIRSFTVKNNVAFKPQNTCEGKWVNEQPNSAVAFSFAYFLQKSANVPIGIILTSWGSSSIEGWMPREMTKTVPHFKAVMNAFDTNSKIKNRIKTIKNGPKPWSKEDNLFARRQSNILYNAMMHPLIPYACKGLVWYQGESNTQSMYGVKNRNAGMLQYDETLKEWVKAYRKSWNNEAMHFMVVMLPGYGKILNSGTEMNTKNPNAHSWAWMRESQLKVLDLPNTSVVNTIDLGDVKDVHPKDKLPIGKRLALLAMDEVLKSDAKSCGPIFKEAKIKENTIVVYFDHAKKLKTKDGKAPTGFWLADDSKNWFPAEAKIKGKTVVLHSSQLSIPKYIRYAFAAVPEVNLVNGIDLPVYPFRTDSFKP